MGATNSGVVEQRIELGVVVRASADVRGRPSEMFAGGTT
jgi:hypothetical protein